MENIIRQNKSKIFAKIPAFVEINARITGMLHKVVRLPLVICDMIMSYFEGMYVDEIISSWGRIFQSKLYADNFNRCIFNMIRLNWESDEKLNRYEEVINRIKLPIEAQFTELDNEIMAYIQSVYDVSGLPNVKKLNASYEMLNAIYSLYFVIMQKHLGYSNKYTLHVWNSRTQRFAPIGLRCSDMPIYPEYESDED